MVQVIRVYYEYFIRIIIIILMIILIFKSNNRVDAETGTLDLPTRQVNVPNLSGSSFTPAIFWFGKVTPSLNYADVRIYYYENSLGVVVHVIDRWLRYDTSPSTQELTEWDSVSLFLNLDGNIGATPGDNSYRFDSQLVWWEDQTDYQASYRGDGSSWELKNIPFTAETGWRGEGAPNDNLEDKGWNVSFTIPFASLGLTSAPPTDTLWGMGVVLHDRDDSNSVPLADTFWPEQMNVNSPATWGQLNFGIPINERSPVLPVGKTIIRQGLNGADIIDGHVGGHTICGEGLDHWTEWGEANYAGYEQINIQNQWDISDYPCFSKYFITFPVDEIPPGQATISATLSMYMFGNAGGGEWGESPDSYIQVLTVDRDWEESTLTWNNSPMALENISGAWVSPMSSSDWVQYFWDVSRAVAQAYNNGEPLRLALYSADGERHTGKYFFSSDISDYDAASRPTLTVLWGDHCSSEFECSFIYIPIITQ